MPAPDPDLSVELLAVETADFALFIRGPRPCLGAFALRGWRSGGFSARRETSPLARVAENITLRYQYEGLAIAQPLLCVECVSPLLNAANVTVRVGTEISGVEFGDDNSNTDAEPQFLPLFFENVEYRVLLTGAPERRVTLNCAAPSLLRGLTNFEARGAMAGTLNFGGNVGQTTFTIEENGKPRLVLSLTVFSAKVDFGRDRLAMIGELSALHRALLLRLLRPTATLGAGVQGKANGLEWLVNLSAEAQEIETTLRRIAERAHHQLSVVEEVRAPRKLKRPGRALSRRMTTQGKDAVLLRRNLPTERRVVQVGTPENRYLKFLARRLHTIGHKWLSLARARYGQPAAGESDAGAQLDRISATLGRIGRALQSEFWREVGEELPVLLNRTTFNFQEPMVRFERRCKAVARALSLDEAGERLLSSVSMEQLYELWTYCKLAEITAHLVIGPGQNPLSERIKVDAFAATLQVGRGATLHIGDEVTLSAQRRFPTYERRGASHYFSPLVPQQPDLVFEMRKRDTLHILDAKYRLMALVVPAVGQSGQGVILNSAGLAAHDLEGAEVRVSPREDDINVMHRYRDAIRVLSTGQSDRNNELEDEALPTCPAACYGVILYPHRPELGEAEAVERALRRLRRFEIGAIPLCPGAPDAGWEIALEDGQVVPYSAGAEQVRALARVVAAMLAR